MIKLIMTLNENIKKVKHWIFPSFKVVPKGLSCKRLLEPIKNLGWNL